MAATSLENTARILDAAGGDTKFGSSPHDETALLTDSESALFDGLNVETVTMSYASEPSRAALVCISGTGRGIIQELERAETVIGRANTCHYQIEEPGVSRTHARIIAPGTSAPDYFIEDLGSSNGTLLNGERVVGRKPLNDGDRIQIGANVLQFFHHHVREDRNEPPPPPWSRDSWRTKRVDQEVVYDDPRELERVMARLTRMPPLVISWEIEELKSLIADAQEGRRFVLQGGDCAETLDECADDVITNKLKILIQMSLVLIRALGRPVVRIGRFAGQYAKPRSKMTEVRNGVELPSYFGDLVNRPEFTAEARRPDPELLLAGYHHSALTLNFIRGLSGGKFSDLRRPEFFDISFFERADLPASLKHDYKRAAMDVSAGLQFLDAIGDRNSIDEMMRVRFFTSHEGLNLNYESAQTRKVPGSESFYDLTTHLPWIGERTRSLSGAHVEFFRGIANPVGVKVGPTADPDDIVRLVRMLNPLNEPGKIVLVTRLGAGKVATALPPLISAICRERQRVLWMCDPMHGNGKVTPSGAKTRNFDDIQAELEETMQVHDTCGTVFGGVHFELTGEDVTECIGGGLVEADLSKNYATLCDPRLNYRQAIQMAFLLAARLKHTGGPRMS